MGDWRRRLESSARVKERTQHLQTHNITFEGAASVPVQSSPTVPLPPRASPSIKIQRLVSMLCLLGFTRLLFASCSSFLKSSKRPNALEIEQFAAKNHSIGYHMRNRKSSVHSRERSSAILICREARRIMG